MNTGHRAWRTLAQPAYEPTCENAQTSPNPAPTVDLFAQGTDCRFFRRSNRSSLTGVPMALSTTATAEDFDRTRGPKGGAADNSRSLSPAVSWGAIVVGAAAAASLSLILLILGVGLGLSSVSPWARDGVSATTFGVSTILWLTLTQLFAAAMGGYLAGRLRTRWTDVQADEVYFRDTAHGFLAWAVASLATAALLTTVIGSILGGGLQAGAPMVGGGASTATPGVGGAVASARTTQGAEDGPTAYFVDSLFRRDASAPADGSAGAAAGAEALERTSSKAAAVALGAVIVRVTR